MQGLEEAIDPFRETILVISEDPDWVHRIEQAASDIQCGIHVLENLGDDKCPAPMRRIPLTEPLEGPDYALVNNLTQIRPAIILLDTRQTALPWARWISVIKTSSATRRNHLLVYNPDPDPAFKHRMHDLGADLVFDETVFQRNLSGLLQANLPPTANHPLVSACSGELSQHARVGIKLHNRGSYDDAHEALETAWMDAHEGEGTLYRALLQITVAHLHLQRGNLRGARKMLLRMRQWLDPLPAECRGIDVQTIRSKVDELRQEMDRAADDDLSVPRQSFVTFPLLDKDV